MQRFSADDKKGQSESCSLPVAFDSLYLSQIAYYVMDV